MIFVIVSGLSGAGKSQAMHALEDIGFYCVDNMPPKLLSKFAELWSGSRRKSSPRWRWSSTVPAAGGQFKDLFTSLDELQAHGGEYKIAIRN